VTLFFFLPSLPSSPPKKRKRKRKDLEAFTVIRVLLWFLPSFLPPSPKKINAPVGQ
jgi:hypothetical protein